jgi:hypothetical protein
MSIPKVDPKDAGSAMIIPPPGWYQDADASGKWKLQKPRKPQRVG